MKEAIRTGDGARAIELFRKVQTIVATDLPSTPRWIELEMLMLASVVGSSIVNVVLVIGFLGWPGVARLVRGQILSLRERDWVLASKALGAESRWIIARHLLPHVTSPIGIAATFGVASAILVEASLSYLELGVRPTAPSWGAMLAEAQSVHAFQAVWRAWLAPGSVLVIGVLAVPYVGDTLRRALDPDYCD